MLEERLKGRVSKHDLGGASLRQASAAWHASRCGLRSAHGRAGASGSQSPHRDEPERRRYRSCRRGARRGPWPCAWRPRCRAPRGRGYVGPVPAWARVSARARKTVSFYAASLGPFGCSARRNTGPSSQNRLSKSGLQVRSRDYGCRAIRVKTSLRLGRFPAGLPRLWILARGLPIRRCLDRQAGKQ